MDSALPGWARRDAPGTPFNKARPMRHGGGAGNGGPVNVPSVIFRLSLPVLAA